MTPRFIPPTIKQKGVKKHLEELGVDYSKFVTMIENGAKDTYIAEKLKGVDNRHTIAKWRKAYNWEKSKAKDEAAIDTLKDV